MIGTTTAQSLANRFLPEGRLKNYLRRRYYRRFNGLYTLNDVIVSASEVDDGSVRVELINGMCLYGAPDHRLRPVFEYADPRRLEKIRPFGRWSIFWQILHEEFVADIYGQALLRPGDIVLDLGAHVGTFAVQAARAVGPTGRVIALEPSSQNAALLRKNTEANGLTNVSVLQYGAWSNAARLTLQLSEMSGAHSFAQTEGSPDPPCAIEEAEVDAVDNILARLGIERVDFIKMDIEGAEIEALKGMSRLLVHRGPRLAIAAYHVVDGAPTKRVVVPRLRALGYDVYERNGIVSAAKKSRRQAETSPGD